MLQGLTTKEPDDSMIEVAIASVEAVFDWKAYLAENFPVQMCIRDRIILSQAVLYVASAPKSNSAVRAVSEAMESVKSKKTTVPAHLQDCLLYTSRCV